MARQAWNICAVALISLTLVHVVNAQEVDIRAGQTDVEVDREGVDVDVSTQRRSNSTDRAMDQQIANWLLIDQRSIVDLAEFGLQRTKTPEVRQLAEAIIHDHQSLADKLSHLSGTAASGSSNRSAPETERNQRRRDPTDDRIDEQREAQREDAADVRRDRDRVRRPLENIADRVEDGIERVADRAERVIENTSDAVDRDVDFDRDRRIRGASPWVAIHGQIASKLVQAARQDLERRQGYEFDASLVGMFVASHLQQEATMEVLANHASSQLQSTLNQAAKTIRQHRQKAEQVMAAIKR